MAEINAVDISELMSKWGKKGGRFVPKRKLLLPGEILRCDRSRNQLPRQLPNLVQFRTSKLRPISQPETRRTVPVLFAPRKSGE